MTGVAADGDRFTSGYAYGPHSGTAVYEIAERTPPRRQVVRSVSGPFRFEGTLELFAGRGRHARAPDGRHGPGGRAGARSCSSSPAPLVRRSMRRRIAAQLERLKTMVELEAAL